MIIKSIRTGRVIPTQNKKIAGEIILELDLLEESGIFRIRKFLMVGAMKIPQENPTSGITPLKLPKGTTQEEALEVLNTKVAEAKTSQTRRAQGR